MRRNYVLLGLTSGLDPVTKADIPTKQCCNFSRDSGPSVVVPVYPPPPSPPQFKWQLGNGGHLLISSWDMLSHSFSCLELIRTCAFEYHRHKDDMWKLEIIALSYVVSKVKKTVVPVRSPVKLHMKVHIYLESAFNLYRLVLIFQRRRKSNLSLTIYSISIWKSIC